jgi:hypothetical protein
MLLPKRWWYLICEINVVQKEHETNLKLIPNLLSVWSAANCFTQILFFIIILHIYKLSKMTFETPTSIFLFNSCFP